MDDVEEMALKEGPNQINYVYLSDGLLIESEVTTRTPSATSYFPPNYRVI